MRIIAPMMILIMMTSTLAGCTSQTDGVNEYQEEDIDSILSFIDDIQEPEWINVQGDSSQQWSLSLATDQWLEVHSANFILNHSDVTVDFYSYMAYGYVVSEEGYIANMNQGQKSPIFGGDYLLCVEFSSLVCYDYPRDSSDYSISEWSVIYRIHNVTDINFNTHNSSTDDDITVSNTNLTMEVSYVPAGMDENARTNVIINIELYTEDAPIHVDNFITHIEKGNYNSTIFHRIIDNFMIQGGDIESLNGFGGYAANWYGYCNGQETGTEDSCSMNDWTIPDEADNGLTHSPGALSMAKTSSPDTGGSQFFIVPSDSNPSHLNGVHTVFGYVTSGLESIKDISEVDTGDNDRPVYDVVIENISMD